MFAARPIPGLHPFDYPQLFWLFAICGATAVFRRVGKAKRAHAAVELIDQNDEVRLEG